MGFGIESHGFGVGAVIIIGSDLLKKGKAIIDYSDNKLFLKS